MRRGPSTIRRVAIVVLPALVVAVVFVWFSALPLRRTLASTQQQHEAVRRDMPSAEVQQRVQARIGVLRDEVATATAARQSAPQAAVAATVPASARARWRLQLSDVLTSHRLRLLGEERIEVELPAAVAQALGGEPVTRWPAWSLRLAGNYLDVVAAIASLQRTELPCHVLDLEMRRDAAGVLSWTLVVG